MMRAPLTELFRKAGAMQRTELGPPVEKRSGLLRRLARKPQLGCPARWSRHCRAAVAAVAALGVASVLAGCGDGGALGRLGEPSTTDSAKSASPSVQELSPRIRISEEKRDFRVKDRLGVEVVLNYSIQHPSVSGVDVEVQRAFDDSFDGMVEKWEKQLESSTGGFAASDLACGVPKGCEIPVRLETSIAEVYEGNGTVLTTERLQFGTTSPTVSVNSFTLDLKTGKPKSLADFLDVADPAVKQRIATAAHAAVAKKSACDSLKPTVTSKTAWAPTKTGMVFVWDQESTAMVCGSVSATVPWESAGAAEAQGSNPVSLPGCEQIVPIEFANELMGSSTAQFGGQKSGTGFLVQSTRMGESARQAFTRAKEVETCTWYIENSDNFLHFSVALLPEEARKQFLSALRDSDYVEGGSSSAPIFTYDDGQRGIGMGPVTYGFNGDFLVHAESLDAGRFARVIDRLA